MRFVAEKSVPKAMTLYEVKMATSLDKTMQKAIYFSRTGNWHEMKRLEDESVNLLELQALRSV